MEKTVLKNRKNLDISVVFEGKLSNEKMVIFAHGLGESNTIPVFESLSKIFVTMGYNSIRFDMTNSIGESDGNLEDATTTNYLNDLEDVISWSEKKFSNSKKIALVGHSLGGLCSGLIAEEMPNKFECLILIGSMISGKLSYEQYPDSFFKMWKDNGILEWNDEGEIKRVKWAFADERDKYDLLKSIEKLTMPILLISGELDNDAPPGHQKMLFDRLSGKKEIHILEGVGHKYRKEEELNKINMIVEKWLDEIK